MYSAHFRGVFGMDWTAFSFKSILSRFREVSLWKINRPVPASHRSISGDSHLACMCVFVSECVHVYMCVSVCIHVSASMCIVCVCVSLEFTNSHLALGTGVSYSPRGMSPVILISLLQLAVHTSSL